MLQKNKLQGVALAILLMLLPLVLFVLPVTAHTDDEDPDHQDREERIEQREENREDRQQEREDRRDERRRLRCDRVTSRVGRIVDRLKGNKSRLIGRLNKVSEKLDSTINRLKEQNIDTANLEAALARFNEQKGLAGQNIEEGISLLRQAIDLVCSIDEGNPGDLIAKANENFKSAKEHIRAAVAIFKNEIVPELRDAFGQLDSN